MYVTLVSTAVLTVITIFLGWRYLKRMEKTTPLTAQIDELVWRGYIDVGSKELLAGCFRVIHITAPGFEGHTLLEICKENRGYYTCHYDDHGILHSSRYVEFIPKG